MGWIQNFIARQIGKKVANDLKLEDKPMDTKKWYASKTVWTAIIGTLLAGVQPISTALGHPITIPQWVFEVLGGMGLYSLRTGDKPIS